MGLITAARITKPRRGSARNSWMNDPDVHLMLLVKREDSAAFAELVKRYWSQVFGQAFRKLRAREDAEDLAQEVFLRLYRHRKRYQPRAKFATWLFHIAQNVFRNALRSRRRRPVVRFDLTGSLSNLHAVGEDGLPVRTESPSRPIERAELARAVRTAISGLAARQRTAVELHQFKDRTYVEVAAEMDMTAKAAKSLLYRARNQLRESLGSYVAANG
jgi:RNA polymerase sigma-70 factor, ECF subfamily